MPDFQPNAILWSAAVTLCIAWALAARRIPAPLALPNERSLHRDPVPRIGGIAILGGWMASWLVVSPSWRWAIPVAVVALISLLDDWRSLPAVVRLAVHGSCAIAAVFLWLEPANMGLFVAEALIIAWMANLYNFMDGADGLAGSMGVIGFAAYAIAALVASQDAAATSFAALATACAVFLAFNLPPARLFMGDVGAVALGFAAALFGLDGIRAGTWPWWFPPLVFAPFIVDASLTLLRRALRGDNLARAHREHCYQRAILMDGGHLRTVAAYAGWMIACAALALAGLHWFPQWGMVPLVAGCAGFALYCRSVDRRWAARSDLPHAG